MSIIYWIYLGIALLTTLVGVFVDDMLMYIGTFNLLVALVVGGMGYAANKKDDPFFASAVGVTRELCARYALPMGLLRFLWQSISLMIVGMASFGSWIFSLIFVVLAAIIAIPVIRTQGVMIGAYPLTRSMGWFLTGGVAVGVIRYHGFQSGAYDFWLPFVGLVGGLLAYSIGTLMSGTPWALRKKSIYTSIFGVFVLFSGVRGGRHATLEWIDDHTITKTVYTDKEVLVIKEIEVPIDPSQLQDHGSNDVFGQEDLGTIWTGVDEEIENILSDNQYNFTGVGFGTGIADDIVVPASPSLQQIQVPVRLPRSVAPSQSVSPQSSELIVVDESAAPGAQDNVVVDAPQQPLLPDVDEGTRKLLIQQALDNKRQKQDTDQGEQQQQGESEIFRDKVSDVVQQIRDNNFTQVQQKIGENNQ